MNFLKGLFDIINTYLFAPILRLFMGITGNHFALSIFLFTLLINLILIPLSIKSQKTTVQQTKLKPKLDELKKKYGDDKQKYSAAMQKLYQEENVSMGGGCLPLIIRLVLIMSVYYLVVEPLTYLTSVSAEAINTVTSAIEKTADLRHELFVIQAVKDGTQVSSEIQNAISDIKFTLFGSIDLTQTPKFTLNFSSLTKEQLILWIVPFLAFATAMLSSIISMVLQKKVNPDAPSMAGMLLTMPLFSLFIAFAAPAGLGFYWACSSLIGGVIQAGVQMFYGPYKMIAVENAKSIVKAYEKEKKLISSEVKTEE